MNNRDEVIRQAAIAAANHAGEVAQALARYIQTAARDGSREALRDALVAQVAGFESTAHDGATYAARVEACKAALRAWDEPRPSHVVCERLGLSASRAVWVTLWDVRVHVDGNVVVPYNHDEVLLLGKEATGSTGEPAVLWAVAETRRRREHDDRAQFAKRPSFGKRKKVG